MLSHARSLAEHKSPADRPVLTWLRRSTSAAYYALFHAIALAVIEQVAAGLPAEDRHRLARSVDHGRVADVCKWITAQPGAGKEHVQPIVASLQDSRDVTRLADIFLRLQQARHEADYDHLATFRKASVLSNIDQVDKGIDLVDSLMTTIAGQRLFALVAMHVQLR